MLGVQVHAYFDHGAPSLPHVQSRKLRAWAVSWNKRLDVLPDVPTYGELSLFSNNDPSWFGLVAPAGTPAPVVKRLREAVAKALREPMVQGRLAAHGLYASGSFPDEVAAQIRKEIDKMQRISRSARISLD